METIDRRFMLGAAGLAGAAAISRLAAAGALNPPMGPVVPTGRSLQEVFDKVARTDAGLAEPRIPVQSLAAGPPYTIAAPGSYYLADNISIADLQTAILITASRVTLDLAGFSISAPASSGNARGISAVGGLESIVIRGGTLANTIITCLGAGVLENMLVSGASVNPAVGLTAGSRWGILRCVFANPNSGGPSISCSNGGRALVEGCAFSECAIGIDVSGGSFAVIRNCDIREAASFGVRFQAAATGLMMDCTLAQCTTGILNQAGLGARVLRNVAISNTTNYSGVANVSTDPATASAWANISL